MDQLPVDPAVLDTIPAIPPPPGVIPNFQNPYSIAPVGRILLSITYGLMAIAVIVRLYTRVRITRAVGADDYLCIAATASVTAYFAVALTIIGSPLGPHMWNVPLSKIGPKLIQGSVAVSDLYSLSAILLKTSVLVLYLRLFRAKRLFSNLIWAGIAIIVIFYSICIILTSYFCRSSQWPAAVNPIQFAILQSRSDCNVPQLNIEAGQGVFSAVSDLYVLAIPINSILGLQLPLRRRLGICAIFLVGLLAIAASIATLYTRFAQRGSIDFSWDSALNIILAGLELHIGVLCSCMPVGFVAFKRASKVSWSNMKNYWHGRQLRPSGHTDSSSELKFQRSAQGFSGKLPKVHRATLTGLRTFIWGSRSRYATESTAAPTTYAGRQSMDEEYHEQLRRVNDTEALSSRSQEGSSHSNRAQHTSVDDRV